MSITRPCPYSEEKEFCKYETYRGQPRFDKCSTCERFLKKKFPDINTSKFNIDENGNVLRDKRMSENEYELTIVFKSETPFYEIGSFIIDNLFDKFKNLQMWHLKRR